MVPNASEITRRRLAAATVLRLGATAFAHAAVAPLIVFIVQIIDGYRVRSFGDWGPFVIPALIIWSVACTVWVLAPWAARLMIRVPRVSVCPNCRYKLEGLMTPACLECGYTLTPEFLTTAAERDAGTREPDTIWLRQIATLGIRFVAGALVPASVIACFVLAIEAIESPRWNSWTPVFAWGFVGVFAAGALFFAARLSVWMVPRRTRFGAETTVDFLSNTQPSTQPESKKGHA